MKQFVKALPKEGDVLSICEKVSWSVRYEVERRYFCRVGH
jgi:hypothetical protein